jgi:hypothetical protein
MPPKPSLKPRSRLLQAAVEGVGGAAGDARLPQQPQHLVVGLAHVQQHRQASLPGDRELRGTELPLGSAVRGRIMKIEADLPYGHRTVGIQRLGQGIQIRVGVTLQIERMQAERWIKVRLAGTEIE